MGHVTKPALEQYRSELIASGRPLLEKHVQPIQAAIVSNLDAMPDLLIEKTRRLPHPEGMVEISAKWFGLDSSQDAAVRALKFAWSEEILGAEESKYAVMPSEEAVLLLFAARYPEGRYLTGRMLVTF